ncbi:MAG: hypothetical protein ACPHK8_07695 [Thermoplasmatota archaeon]
MAELVFHKRTQFYWKIALLGITTVALIPILYFEHELGAKVYLWFLVIVHLLGLVLVFWHVDKEDIAPDRRGLIGRTMGLVTMGVLLYFISKGIGTGLGSTIFWLAFFASWLLHTAGVALMHIRTRREAAKLAADTQQ